MTLNNICQNLCGLALCGALLCCSMYGTLFVLHPSPDLGVVLLHLFLVGRGAKNLEALFLLNRWWVTNEGLVSESPPPRWWLDAPSPLPPGAGGAGAETCLAQWPGRLGKTSSVCVRARGRDGRENVGHVLTPRVHLA